MFKDKINTVFGVFHVLPDQNQTVLVFRGSVYWTVSAAGAVSGPLPLRQRWPELPAAIEAAAFSPLDSKWYFFKGAASPSCLLKTILNSDENLLKLQK